MLFSWVAIGVLEQEAGGKCVSLNYEAYAEQTLIAD